MRRFLVTLTALAAVSLAACAGGPSSDIEQACGQVATVKQRVNELAAVRGDHAALGRATGAIVAEVRVLQDESRQLGVTTLEELAAQSIEEVSTAAGIAMTTADGEAAAARIDPTVQEMIAFCREAGAF